MTGWITRRLLFLALAFAGTTAHAQAPLIVGAVVSQTGAHADLASDYARGLELWRDQLNGGGGLLGRNVELRLLDDASDASKAGPLYARLIGERVDALIGPYGTAATLVAAAQAEAAQKVMVNGAGWSRVVHSRAPRYVFQSAVPYTAYGAAVMDFAYAAGFRSALVLSRDDPVATEMTSAALDSAKRLGVVAVEPLTYSGGTLDFVPIAMKARAAGVEVWIAFGEVRDAAEMLKALKKLQYAPKLFFVRGAADERLLEMVGQDAEAAMGAHAWQPDLARPGNAAFVQTFRAKWSRNPTTAAAEGYAAGSVLAEGVRKAGTTEARALRAAMASLHAGTLLGPYRVDPATGQQTGALPVLVQIQRGERRVVAPPRDAIAPAVLPYPAWADRRIIK